MARPTTLACGSLRAPKRLPLTTLALALGVLLLGCGPSGGGGAKGTGELAPEFELPRLEGGTVKLADLRGKTVLIDFWATWCAPCIVEIPELNAFQAEHRAKGVEVLAISIDTLEDDALKEWVAEHDVQYAVARGDVALAERYRAFEFPFHVLVSPTGEILERLSPGFHDRSELSAALAKYTGS